MTISFTKVKLPYGWLGNMAPFPIIYNNKTWKTSEALFQALRFSDEEVQEEIRGEKSPMAAKMVAKKYLSEKSVVVSRSKKDIENMKLVLKLKINQHPSLKQKLIDTGDEVIIEDTTSRIDVFWGAGLVNGEWVGENILGKLWMEVRNEIKSGGTL